mmetsp:Transcript_81665/g.206227  ORF Transcript_81665/g.206227 Transcript_81665/m.206227 type:complete len:281 (-) Transcript_81665:765-1607(-)
MPFSGRVIQSVMLDANSVAFQHALDKPVYELCDRIHTSQPLVQRRGGALWSQQTWVRWGLLAGRQHASGLVGREDPAQLLLRGTVQVERLKDLPGIRHEGAPLLACNRQMLVCLLHGAACVPLRPPGEVAHDLRDQELEAASLLRLVPLCDLSVRVQRRIRHPRIHQGIGQPRQAEDASATAVERSRVAEDALASSHQRPRSCMACRDGLLAQHASRCCGAHILDRSRSNWQGHARRELCRGGVHDEGFVRLENLHETRASCPGKMIGRNLGTGDEDAPR